MPYQPNYPDGPYGSDAYGSNNDSTAQAPIYQRNSMGLFAQPSMNNSTAARPMYVQEQQHVAPMPTMSYGTPVYYDSSRYFQQPGYGPNYPLYQQQQQTTHMSQLPHVANQSQFYGSQFQASTFDGSNDNPLQRTTVSLQGGQAQTLPRLQSPASSNAASANQTRYQYPIEHQSHSFDTYPNHFVNPALNTVSSVDPRPTAIPVSRPSSQSAALGPGINTSANQPQPISAPPAQPLSHVKTHQEQFEQAHMRETQFSDHSRGQFNAEAQLSKGPQVKVEYPHQGRSFPALQLPAKSIQGPPSAPLKQQPKKPPNQLQNQHAGQPIQSHPKNPVHSVKRRKSNEGAPLPVLKPSHKVNGNGHLKVAGLAPSSSPLTDLASSQVPPTPPSLPSVDYQATLLNLSDEYISAAYSMSTSLAGGEVPADRLDEYYALVSTGMSCLESVLNNYRILDARKEARIRLRLASLMYEETENDMDAEAILSKGIALCERARLADPKYSMHHLLARIWFKGGQARAAMKAVDKLIDEVEKLQLTHWIYAFRFLRVSFGLQVDAPHQESVSLVKHLAAIGLTASKTHAVAVIIVASALEALVHLRAQTPDSVDLAQRALAAARTHQLSAEMAALSQARALLDAADLACHLMRLNHEQASAKLLSLRQNLDNYYEDPEQSKDGCWLLPLSEFAANSDDIECDTSGILKQTSMGQYGLSMAWLTRTQATTLGFLLSGVTAVQKANTEQMPETFLGEGISLNKVALENNRASLSTASGHTLWQDRMRITLQAYVVFSRCARADWETAMKGMGSIRQFIATARVSLDEDTSVLVDYLEAIGKHGLGHLRQALELYRSPSLQLPATFDNKTLPNVNSAHLKVLAVLNSILILRKLGASAEADELLHWVEPMCIMQHSNNGSDHGNRAIESAFHALKSTAQEMTIVKTKQFIQLAIGAAQKVGNDRLLNILMNHMTHVFFANIVGRQAEQSAKVGRVLAKRSGDRLWMAVADRMFSETTEKSGNLAEAQSALQQGEQAMARLPASLRAALFAPDL